MNDELRKAIVSMDPDELVPFLAENVDADVLDDAAILAEYKEKLRDFQDELEQKRRPL